MERREIQGKERIRSGLQDATGGREVISHKIKEEGTIQQRMRQKYLGRSGGQRTHKGEMCNMSI